MTPLNPLNIAQALCRIIQTQMGLGNDQVWIYDQKRDIPRETKLWVVVRFLTGKPFGNTSRFSNGIEYQNLNMNSVFTIDIFSRDDSALSRKEEILLALGSSYAQSQQETFSFKVARLPVSFTDVSLLEGNAIPYRFSMNVQLQYSVELTKAVPYYDQFSNTITPEG